MPLYTKPYTKKIDALRMSHGCQPPKFNWFDGRATLSNPLHISSKRVVMLKLKRPD